MDSWNFSAKKNPRYLLDQTSQCTTLGNASNFSNFYMRIVLTDITHLRKEELFGSDQFDGIHLRGPVGADVYTNMVYDSVQKSAQKYNPKPKVTK